MDKPANILLTGVTGFLGSHLAALALERGYAVRGSMRNLDRADAIRRAIAAIAPTERLSFVQADLMDVGAWDKAMEGMDY
ncbi:MAG: GDP-mannose 4,6-dehydratase, partial [Bacteroidota bacterium]